MTSLDLTLLALLAAAAAYAWWLRGRRRDDETQHGHELDELRARHAELLHAHTARLEAMLDSMIEGLIVIDARGRIYFTDPRYSRPETMELTHESIYRLDPSGALARLGSPLRRPNGIVLMRDGRTLIVGDNASTENVAALWAFDVASDGSLSQARKIHDFGGGRGPDGMTLDRDGRVWVTAGTGAKAGVYVFQLDAPRTAATPLAFLPLPDQPTNCTFGGAERDVLYITTDSALFRVRTLVSGAPTPPGK